MHVTVLSPDLSHNCLGRAYVLARLLERTHDVDLVGPELAAGVWEPLQNEFEYSGVPTSRHLHRFLLSIPAVRETIEGEVVVASKPRLESYGVALLNRLQTDRPVILDVDDWESGFAYRDTHPALAYAKGLPKLVFSNSFYYKRACEALASKADARTVSNRFLRNRFGGTLIPHARDTNRFHPRKFDAEAARKEFNIPAEKFVVMFSGTPRPHKGVEDLVDAVTSLKREDILGVIVGADDSAYANRLRRKAGDTVRIEGMQPFDDLPRWISASDIVAIPQRASAATRGQLPAKVFDAMAMGKPVLATDVGDLPYVLSDGGEIVPPGSPSSLADAIRRLAADESRRNAMGSRARERCVERYSYDALAPTMDEVVASVR